MIEYELWLCEFSLFILFKTIILLLIKTLDSVSILFSKVISEFYELPFCAAE